MKHIISPGFAKSGTTLMHFLLGRSPLLVGPSVGKELNVFNKEIASPYQTNFHCDSSHLATIEFSPTYFTGATLAVRRSILKRIKTSVPDAIILMAIRHPLERAISHYIHLLQDFARFGRGRYTAESRNMNEIYGLPFDAAVAVEASVGLDMAEALNDVFEIFDRESVVLFFLETDGKNLLPFLQRLGDALGQDILVPNPETLPKVNVGKDIPQHFYSEIGKTRLSINDQAFDLPPGTLYIASAKGHVLLNGIDPQIGRSWSLASKLWTTEYDATFLNRIWNLHFAPMAAAIDQVTSASQDATRSPRYSDIMPKARTIERTAFSAEFLAKALALPLGRKES